MRFLLILFLSVSAIAQESGGGGLLIGAVGAIPAIPSSAVSFLNLERGSTSNGGPHPDTNASSWVADNAESGGGAGTCTLSFGNTNLYDTPYGTMDINLTPSANGQFTNCLAYRRLQDASGNYPTNLAQLNANWKQYHVIIPTASCGKLNGLESDGDIWNETKQSLASLQFLSSGSTPASAIRLWNGAGGDPYGDWTGSAFTQNIIQQCEQDHYIESYQTFNQAASTYCFQGLRIDGVTKYANLNQCYSGYADTSIGKIGTQWQLDLNTSAVSGTAYKARVYGYNEYWAAPATSATIVVCPNGSQTGNAANCAPTPTLAFGSQNASTASPALPISVNNCSTTNIAGCTGTGSTTLGALAVSGTNASDFVVNLGTCTAGQTITSGGSCKPTVTFTPSQASGTAETATLTVNYSGGSKTLALTGTSDTMTSVASSSCPSALAAGKYQLTADISCGGTAFTVSSGAVDLNLNGHTLIYGTANQATQIDAIQNVSFNMTPTVHNGTITEGAGLNTFASKAALASTTLSGSGVGSISIVSGGNYGANGTFTDGTYRAGCGGTGFTYSYTVTGASGGTGGSVISAAVTGAGSGFTCAPTLIFPDGIGAGSRPLPSLIGSTGSNAYGQGSFYNLTANLNMQYANVIDTAANLIAHDLTINSTGPGFCGNVGCRNVLQSITLYQDGASSATANVTHIFNVVQNGGPQGGFKADSPGAEIAYNNILQGNATGTNTQNFGIFAWGFNANVHHNLIMTPFVTGGGMQGRGIQVSDAQALNSSGKNVHDNVVTVYNTQVNTEYASSNNGCQLGGVYGMQFDDNPIGPNTLQNNKFTAIADVCPAQAGRISETNYATNVSQGNTYTATRDGSAPACTFGTWSEASAGCATGFSVDGPTAFTSISDTVTADSSDFFFSADGGSGVVFQSTNVNKGANPSGFNTISAANGPTSPVSAHIIDATFNTGTSATDTNIRAQGSNQGTVSVFIDWTQTLTVTKASGPLASGAAVTFTDALSNTYTCTTNSSGVCAVPVTQYRNNNDSAANAHESRNPYSIGVSLSGCTTNTVTGVTVSATGARAVTLAGC